MSTPAELLELLYGTGAADEIPDVLTELISVFALAAFRDQAVLGAESLKLVVDQLSEQDVRRLLVVFAILNGYERIHEFVGGKP